MRLRSVDFDTIAPLMPFDRTASQVAGKGEHFHWEPSQPHKVHSSSPLVLRRPTDHELAQAHYVDLTGTKMGRLTILGVAADSTSAGQSWVARCVCGSYETRKARAVKKWLAGEWNGDHEPMCDSCGYTRRLQMGKHNPKKAAAAAAAIMEAAR